MTAYYQPLQRESDKRWDMTCGTGSRPAYPIGYCAGGCGGCEGKGHDTGAEASACYDGYLLDTCLTFFVAPNEQQRCATCQAWTTGRGDLKGDAFVRPVPLCEAHQSRDDMAAALAARKVAKLAAAGQR